MPYKLSTRSSTDDLEKEIRVFAEESGQSLSEIYRRAHALYMNNERLKRKPKKGEIEDGFTKVWPHI